MHRTAVKQVVMEGVLDANDALAQANRTRFDQSGTYVINMMSSPGAGKTALLERTLERMRSELRLGVLEGDVQTTLDADRLARFHIPLVQVNTDPGFGGECHLDANMVRSGLSELSLDEIDVLVIENVGNLVCPAEFKVGEDARVMVYSVTEGEEKPLKYPLMFRSADLVLVNKVDLLEHLDFDLEMFLGNLDAVNRGVEYILTSARTGRGVEEWCSWLERGASLLESSNRRPIPTGGTLRATLVAVSFVLRVVRVLECLQQCDPSERWSVEPRAFTRIKNDDSKNTSPRGVSSSSVPCVAAKNSPSRPLSKGERLSILM
jgi:hydrogenase nickel incorporation protein HypB